MPVPQGSLLQKRRIVLLTLGFDLDVCHFPMILKCEREDDGYKKKLCSPSICRYRMNAEDVVKMWSKLAVE